MEYNLDVTTEHPLATFAQSLNSLIKSDGGKGIFNDDVVAISLDDVEKSFKKGIHNETMDVAVGVIRKGSSKNPKGKRMLLCEFRLNYKKPENISKTEIDNKIRNSKSMLQSGYIGNIHDKYFFLFSYKVVNQAKSYIARRMAGRIKDIEVITEQDFKEMLWS